jgi:hypothetical protein
MNKLLIVALATGIAIAPPLSAFAAGTPVAAGTKAVGAMQAAAAPTNAMAAATLSEKSTFSQVTVSLAGGAKIDLSKVNASTKLSIVKISTLKGYKAGTKISAADMAGIRSLQAQVMANAALTAKLKAAGFSPTDVVAGSADASGGVTLVINK